MAEATATTAAAQSLLDADWADAVAQLGTDVATGLSQGEVERRLHEHGPNEVRERRSNPWLQFGRKFWGLSAWMLELIIVLSLVLGHHSDVYVVSALLLVNAVLGFWQERRADAAVEALRRRLQVQARALRDGQWQAVPARDLVPGDVVRLRPGDFVPADAKLLDGALGADQSSLTGESLEVGKEAGDVLYSGSIVRRGEATALVLLTGARTFFGRTTELVQVARPKLHAETIIARVVRWLFAIVVALLGVAFAFSLVRGYPLLEMLPLALVLLLGAVPVALPAMFTVTMALGAHRLVRNGVLVTRLNASDDAASMRVLCVDKTGTLTANRPSVTGVLPSNGATADEVLRLAAIASEEANHDPIDTAIIEAARARGLLEGLPERLGFTPFDALTRRTEAVVAAGQGVSTRITKGAVESVAAVAHLDDSALAELRRLEAEATADGSRALAVARTGEDGWHVAGLVVLADTPRPDASAMVARLQQLGVAVKMLTGDALPVARCVAARLGLGPRVHRLDEVRAAADATTAGRLVDESDGFAEVYPEGKYDVVRGLQARGHIVGMTGDGVNDAPALRQAEVGIATSNASDVAKGAASVVLMVEGLAGIVDLVLAGREMHERIATWVVNKVSRTILKTAFVVVAYLLTERLVVSSFAMLLMMLLTDFVKVSLSTDNARPSLEPTKWDVGALVKVAVVVGLLMVFEALGLLYVGLQQFGMAADPGRLSTFSFAVLFYFAMFSIIVVRERRRFWMSLPSRTLLLAIGADMVVGTLIVTLGLPGMSPLAPVETLTVLATTAVCSLLVNDAVKLFAARHARLTW